MAADNFPGSLLIRLGLGRDAIAKRNPWEEMQALSQVRRSQTTTTTTTRGPD